jgi:hypothetical protein
MYDDDEAIWFMKISVGYEDRIRVRFYVYQSKDWLWVGVSFFFYFQVRCSRCLRGAAVEVMRS